MTSPAALFQDKLGESDRGGQVFIYTNFSGGCMVKKAYKKKRYILVLVKTFSRRAGETVKKSDKEQAYVFENCGRCAG